MKRSQLFQIGFTYKHVKEINFIVEFHIGTLMLLQEGETEKSFGF